MKLEFSNIKYKESFIEAINELVVDNGDPNNSCHPALSDINSVEKFDKYLQKLRDDEKGVGLPEGYVSCSTYWMIDDEDRYVGGMGLRHCLTDALLKFGGHIGYEVRPSARGKGYGTEALKQCLEFARDMGLDRVLITCYRGNIGSIKIIENNGGILQDEIENEGHKDLTRRYWISL